MKLLKAHPTRKMQEEEPEEAQQDEEAQEQSEKEQTDQIVETGSVTTSPDSRHVIHCLTIIGQIEGHYICLLYTSRCV